MIIPADITLTGELWLIEDSVAYQQNTHSTAIHYIKLHGPLIQF